MAIRTILYGYTVKNGVTVIIPTEAEVVRSVFDSYIKGKTLKTIADELTERQVLYFDGKASWNKGIINRMIENRHYLGSEKYPSIISSEVFESAMAKKESKGCKQEKQSENVELLKILCVCGCCGGRFRRISTWGSREKWICANGCKSMRYIDDNSLEASIINVINNIKRKPGLLDVESESVYSPNNEVHFLSNELSRLLEQPEVDFQTTASMILNEASAKFTCCSFADGELTDCLKEEISSREVLEQLPFDVLKKYIRRIKILVDGTISVIFINGAEIISTGGITSEYNRTENSYENRSESVAC